MRLFLFSFFFLLSFGLSAQQDLDQFQFLEGTWRSTEVAGSQFTEVWVRNEDGTYTGEGVFVENGDTLSHEHLTLTSVRDGIVYIAAPDSFTPVLFNLSADSKPNSFVFENPEHDYPQVISYFLHEDDRMLIEVGSLDGQGFQLEMQKIAGPVEATEKGPLFKNDAVVFGILLAILGFVFYTSSSSAPGWRKFYSRVPALLLCYFLPGILNSLNIISGEESGLYKMASAYLLPSSLLLLCVGIDFKGILQLGPKALIMFLTGTLGVIIGAPLALWIVSLIEPSILQDLGADSAWRGLSTVAGSWIGGGANQAAMKEVFQPSDALFSVMVAVDVLVANVWMAVILLGAGNTLKVDKWLKSDTRALDTLRDKLEKKEASSTRISRLPDTMIIVAVAFAGTGLAHLLADFLAPWLSLNMPFLEKFSLTAKFFWIVVIATTIGLLLSFTRARNLENTGASRIGSVFLYVLVATIGMNMDITAITERPILFLVGFIWISIHALLLIVVAKWIKAPLFYAAVGSQANIGGAASAPVVASAFHPSLAPVGVLLAVFGYALGTYGAWLTGIIMQGISK